MGLAKLPFVLERFDVVCYDASLGVKLCQLESGAVVVLAFQPVDARGTKGQVESAGNVRVGDALLCIDEMPIELLMYDEILDKLRDEDRPMTLTFGRTEEDVTQQVRERASEAQRKHRQIVEQERLLEIEVERKQREHRARAGASGAAPAGNGTGEEAGGRALYTSKDFRGTGLRPAHKLILGVASLILIAAGGYLVDVDVFQLPSVLVESEAGMAETFHLHKSQADSHFSDALARAGSSDHRAANGTHVRPGLRNSTATTVLTEDTLGSNASGALKRSRRARARRQTGGGPKGAAKPSAKPKPQR